MTAVDVRIGEKEVGDDARGRTEKNRDQSRRFGGDGEGRGAIAGVESLVTTWPGEVG